MKKNIYLIGFMGTGKTTVSGILARQEQLDEIDLDAEIEKRKGMKIREIFDAYGEAYFRDLESRLVQELEQRQGSIISCGGGCVLRKENVKSMRRGGTVILLTATPQTIYERVKKSRNRPMLDGKMNVDYISEMMEKREKAYEEAADFTVCTDDKTAKEIALEIANMVKL